MEEIWKSVKDYEGYYEISNFGTLRSVDRWVRTGKGKGYLKFIPSKILAPSVNNSGYKIYMLSKPKTKPICKTIHRMVAEVFLDNPFNLSDVNHKDEDKFNNRVDNLEWCTHIYNMNYGIVPKKISNKLKGTSNRDNMWISLFIKEWIPIKFKEIELFEYEGIIYESREILSKTINKSRARICQMEKEGKIKIIKDVRVV